MATTTQIRFVQTGGFGGLKLTAEVDTEALPASEKAALEQLVDAVLAEQPGRPAGAGAHDDLQYEVQVTRGGTSKVLHASDANATPSLGALIRDLAGRAEPSR